MRDHMLPKSRITVEPCGEYVTVKFSEIWPPPQPVAPNTIPPCMDIAYVAEYVTEPNWLMAFLGDSLQKRIERAKDKVIRRAIREIERRERVARAVEECR